MQAPNVESKLINKNRTEMITAVTALSHGDVTRTRIAR